MRFFFFSVYCMFDKNQKSCATRIHFVTDEGLHKWKAFYNIKFVFIHPLWMITNWSVNKLSNSVSENFKSIFLRMYFSSIATFFLELMVICLYWHLHLQHASLGFTIYHWYLQFPIRAYHLFRARLWTVVVNYKNVMFL